MESALHSSGDQTLQEFFKVFLLKTGSAQLQIPKSFTKFFNGTTPCKATLVDQDINSRDDICLEKVEDRLVFKSGWEQFAKEKGLEEGDFLVFQYDGNSSFYVKIFSKTGCRKVAAPPPPPAPACCEKVAVPIVILDEDSNLNSKKNRRGRKRKNLSTTVLKTNENKKPVLEGPSEGAQSKLNGVKEENVNRYEMKPDLANLDPPWNPHFSICLTAWKLNRVEIPRLVLKKFNIILTPRISIRDENDNLWPVAIITTAPAVVIFCPMDGPISGGATTFTKVNGVIFSLLLTKQT
ncbi:putative B3 domain-containing protein At5g66980 [Abrus precatorius]|uniref:B3 domain-containing protein At5g66980 n=1 Tax=Abrus precatorius TaxID=3816 RepID=A0A8B8L288_ABRPR|nr:putative B3 domain-containing protein At5g66980 [Abrus precatorius]XP_027350297.1 putative B3 domain-containing protein At5g66980 [Abrus precatorius]